MTDHARNPDGLLEPIRTLLAWAESLSPEQGIGAFADHAELVTRTLEVGEEPPVDVPRDPASAFTLLRQFFLDAQIWYEIGKTCEGLLAHGSGHLYKVLGTQRQALPPPGDAGFPLSRDQLGEIERFVTVQRKLIVASDRVRELLTVCGSWRPPTSADAQTLRRMREIHDFAAAVPAQVTDALFDATQLTRIIRSEARAAVEGGGRTTAEDASDETISESDEPATKRIASERDRRSEFEKALASSVSLAREKGRTIARAMRLRDPYAGLLADAAPGITTEYLKTFFETLAAGFTGDLGLLHRTEERHRLLPPPLPIPPMPEDVQLRIIDRLAVISGIGNPILEAHGRGRFCHELAPRFMYHLVEIRESNPLNSLNGAFHEQGHLEVYGHRNPRDPGHSYGSVIDEGIARMGELHVFRTSPFAAVLVRIVTEELQRVGGWDEAAERAWTAENVFAHFTHVRKGAHRAGADALTYTAYIIRYHWLDEFLINSVQRPEDAVKELPTLWETWGERLGLQNPPGDPYVMSIMREIHWATGRFAYFPAYSLADAWSSVAVEAIQHMSPAALGRAQNGDMAAFNLARLNVLDVALARPTIPLAITEISEIAGRRIATPAGLATQLLTHLEATFKPTLDRGRGSPSGPHTAPGRRGRNG